ncbi:MAG: hypothetical protein WC833_14415 [Bacteroidales bacterium]|jgi:hypothetical protein
MNENIIAAIITAATPIVTGLLVFWWKKRHAIHPIPKKEHEVAIITPITSGSIIATSALDLTKPIADITPLQIIETIESSTPFYKQKIKNSFIGTKVSWNAELCSISIYEHQGTIYDPEAVIFAKIYDSNFFLSCASTRKNCDMFKTLKKGAKISITGEIKSISTYDADLINCIFENVK